MQGSGLDLPLGRSVEMHFFEPRYRLLIRRIMAEKGHHHRKFAFLTTRPAPGKQIDFQYGRLCEAHHVQIQDRQTNLNAFPINKLRIVEAWEDKADLRSSDPPLFYVRAKVLPASDFGNKTVADARSA